MNDMTTETTSDRPQTSTRAPAPEGMTYNRKGVLVRKRASPNRSAKLYAVMRVSDGSGNYHEIDRRNVEVIATFRNSDKVLEMLDSDEHQGAFFVRLDVPSGR